MIVNQYQEDPKIIKVSHISGDDSSRTVEYLQLFVNKKYKPKDYDKIVQKNCFKKFPLQFVGEDFLDIDLIPFSFVKEIQRATFFESKEMARNLMESIEQIQQRRYYLPDNWRYLFELVGPETDFK